MSISLPSPTMSPSSAVAPSSNLPSSLEDRAGPSTIPRSARSLEHNYCASAATRSASTVNLTSLVTSMSNKIELKDKQIETKNKQLRAKTAKIKRFVQIDSVKFS